MSTKIYNAYICKLGFPYLNLIIEEIRKDYTEAVALYLKDVPRQLRGQCITHYLEDAIVIYSLKNGDILFQMSMYNLPYKSLMPTLGLLLTFGKVADYHYQDQSDLAETLSEIERSFLAEAEFDYAQRETDWNEVFSKGRSRTPAEVGYTIPLIRDKIELEWRR